MWQTGQSNTHKDTHWYIFGLHHQKFRNVPHRDKIAMKDMHPIVIEIQRDETYDQINRPILYMVGAKAVVC